MSGVALFAVFVGAGLGAWLRWWFSMVLNPLFPTIPMGTVAANLVGGFLVGLAGGYFSHNASVAPEWRLLIITGFMGGLTTFSTFSLEVVNLVGRQQYGWALAQIGLHLLGSLALTALGILAAQALFARF